MERYPEIFEATGEEVTEYERNFGKKWQGYASVDQLADGDLLKYDSIIARELEECLLALCYRADKFQLERLLHKQSLKKM